MTKKTIRSSRKRMQGRNSSRGFTYVNRAPEVLPSFGQIFLAAMAAMMGRRSGAR